MKRFLCGALVTLFAFGLPNPARADDQDVKSILDKAIKALGGAEKLGKAAAFSDKAKGTITFNGNDNEFNAERTFQGLDRYRSEFDGTFGGNMVHGVTVVNGDRGWRKFGDNNMELDTNALANDKR